MLEVGTILESRYEVQRLLGQGAMATVWLVRHTGLFSLHALKVLEAHLARDEDLRARFIAEGRIQAQLRHPNIVSVSDIVTGSLAGLVMEYVDGTTLDEWLASLPGRPGPTEIRQVFFPVLDAVGAAHQRGIVHRDLKPGNIIVSKNPDGSPRPMVTDFGIAKVLNDDHVRTGRQKTMTGVRMGTLHYMSPEQVRGSAGIDARSDIFALGSILYEMSTGRLAFAADTEYDTMRRIVEGEVEAPDRLVEGLNPALSACILRCLNQDPEARFPDTLALRHALEHALAAPNCAIPEKVVSVRPGLAPLVTPRPAPPRAEPRSSPQEWSLEATILEILREKGQLQAHELAWEVEARGLKADRARVTAILRGTLSGRVTHSGTDHTWRVSQGAELLPDLPGQAAPPVQERAPESIGIPRVYPSPPTLITHITPKDPASSSHPVVPLSSIGAAQTASSGSGGLGSIGGSPTEPPVLTAIATRPPEDLPAGAIPPDPEASPLLSALLTLCMPGLGQIMNRQHLKGLSLLLFTALSSYYISPWLLPALLPIWMLDAWLVARRRRSGRWVSRLGI